MTFDDVLPRLIHAYERGVLVPFIGSGMSAPYCPDWKGMIEGLASGMELPSLNLGDRPDSATLTQIANDLVRRLRMEGPDALPNALSQVLYRPSDPAQGTLEIPLQTRALARVWWPLVLTTNYDDLFEQAAAKEKKGYVVYGRRQLDCQTVLSSLTEPSSPILWALQGYLSRNYPSVARSGGNRRRQLAQQLVVGHEHYRRVTHREPHFRRAFADVFRNRSLMFLGSGLQESYLVDLFGEIQELFGASPHCHYAFMKRDKNKPNNTEFLRAALNVIVVEYDDHKDLPEMLDLFRQALETNRTQQTHWAFSLRTPSKLHSDNIADLEVIRGGLPLPSSPAECIAVSAGLSASGQPLPGTGMMSMRKAAVAAGLLSNSSAPVQVTNRNLIWEYPEAPIFCVVARPMPDVRDLRVISQAVEELCEIASERGYHQIRTQLLAAGNAGVARSYTPLYSLVESVRGFARWKQRRKEQNRDSSLRLTFHLVAPDVLFNLKTGRIDLGELLSQRDIRFWVETVYPTGSSDSEVGNWSVERRIEFADPMLSVRELMQRYTVPEDWMIRLLPQPVSGVHAKQVSEVRDETLEAFGIVPGCTLRFLPALV